MNGIAARHLAETGFPIFPCQEGGKKPLTKRGFKDATNDLEQVTLWWAKWPDANIGFPTGKTGVVVLDLDPRNGGKDSLSELEREAGPLPETFMVATGGGGAHYYLRRPQSGLMNSAGKIGPGLDIRGEGGYILLPPSRTTGRYKTLNEYPIAPVPSWLLELLREPKPRVEGWTGPVDLAPIGAPIFRGRRNSSLASIAGSLRACGHSREEIETHLHQTNAARCRPPLPPKEVNRIAASIARYPAGRAAPATTPEVLAVLDGIEAAVISERWPGMGGSTDRGVLVALIALSRSHSVLIPAGVRVSVSHRDLALLSGTSLPTVGKAVLRLSRAGLVSKDNHNRKRDQAGFFVLRAPDARKGYTHNPQSKESGTSVKPLRAHRHGPGRLGKKCEQVIETLLRSGGSVTLGNLEISIGTRGRDLKRRQLSKLESAGVVTLADDTVVLAQDWRERLNDARRAGGEIDAERADKLRYEREREAYRQQYPGGEGVHS